MSSEPIINNLFNPSSSKTSTKEKLDVDSVQKAIKEALKPDKSVQDSLTEIANIKADILPCLLRELLSSAPNPDVSVTVSRANMALKEIANLIVKRREMELSEAINPKSPRFQKAFYMFIELFYQTLVENNIDETQLNNIFNSFSTKLTGWEDAIENSLKGVSTTALDQVKNPFIQNLKTTLESKPSE